MKDVVVSRSMNHWIVPSGGGLRVVVGNSGYRAALFHQGATINVCISHGNQTYAILRMLLLPSRMQ